MSCLDRVLNRTAFLIAFSSLTWSHTTFGQQEADQSAEREIEEVVVVGTRAEPRSVTDSTVPVDVISNEAFDSQAVAHVQSHPFRCSVVPHERQPFSGPAALLRQST